MLARGGCLGGSRVGVQLFSLTFRSEDGRPEGLCAAGEPQGAFGISLAGVLECVRFRAISRFPGAGAYRLARTGQVMSFRAGQIRSSRAETCPARGGLSLQSGDPPPPAGGGSGATAPPWRGPPGSWPQLSPPPLKNQPGSSTQLPMSPAGCANKDFVVATLVRI